MSYLQIVDKKKIYIKDDDRETVLYYALKKDYEADSGQKFPKLPEGCKNVGYLQGHYKRGSTGNTDVILDIPWAEGDGIIANLPALKAAMEARNANSNS